MRNSRQAKQNDLLLKFLLIATVFFIVLVGILFWQQREVPTVAVTEEHAIIHFSDRSEPTSVTAAYLYGSKYIHDIEAYPQIRDLFFNVSFPELTDKNKIAESLAEVKVEKASEDEFGKVHVYSTSYYIGNLLISPDLTLHTLLANGTKPKTSIVLDSALSDVRSGVIKIQNFFDVAPPSYYDEAFVGAVYFPTASFPSLTVAEAGIVLYLLAELDPVNARLYEQFLHQYANQVLASGANFYQDIKYSLNLASAYLDIIKENSDYQNLLEDAREEWVDTKKVSLANYTKIKFPLNKFPYESRYEILKPKVNSFKSIDSNEKLGGDLMLSLVDNRLPEPSGKLYSYSLTSDSLLPFAVDLHGRKFNFLKEAVASFAGVDQNKYFFATGDKPIASEAGNTFFAGSQVFYREGDEVVPFSGSNESNTNKIQSNLQLSPGHDRLLYNELLWEQKSNPDSWDIKLDKIVQGKLLKSEVIARGSSPVLVLGGEIVMFWREGNIWQVNTNTGSEQIGIVLPKIDGLDKDFKLDYLEDTQTLLISRSYLELETLEPKVELTIHKLAKSKENALEVKKLYEFEIKDGIVLSVKQSPGGSYLAMLVKETIGERRPRLLIFDISNGIIKKELDLTPYSNKAMTIDEWLTSE